MKKNKLSKLFPSGEIAIAEYKKRKLLHDKYLSRIRFFHSFDSSGDLGQSINEFWKN